MLTQSEVARFLLRRELISAMSIVDGSLRVEEASRRNRNFKVKTETESSFLLKQGLSANGRATVAHEARVYQKFESTSNLGLREYLPGYSGFDADQGVLILQLLQDAQDFRDHHSRRKRFSVRMAAELGTALSTLHRGTTSELGVDGESKMPWVLSLDRPGLELFRDLSLANIQLIRIIQNTPDFPRMLKELRDFWRADSMVHHDIKWDNCMVVPSKSLKHKFEIKIIDWEFAALGDSCWDAGAIFSNYLSFWLFSIPVSGEEPPDHFLELAQYPLNRMQPAMRAYWQSYVRGMRLEPHDSVERLMRAVRYAGARLVQTAFERMQHATALTGDLICLLQLSLNVMQRPREAAVHLLGISLVA
jgi:Phosphotransferase enzyme family